MESWVEAEQMFYCSLGNYLEGFLSVVGYGTEACRCHCKVYVPLYSQTSFLVELSAALRKTQLRVDAFGVGKEYATGCIEGEKKGRRSGLDHIRI